jgi:hypothetical protein
MPWRYDFGVSFEVVITECEDWDNVPSEQEAIVYYTAGSGKDGQTGIGIYGHTLRHYEALGSTSIIFQAEMYAISVWARTRGQCHIFIMSDSQVTLRAVRANAFNFKLEAEYLDSLKRLTTKYKLTLTLPHDATQASQKMKSLTN